MNGPLSKICDQKPVWKPSSLGFEIGQEGSASGGLLARELKTDISNFIMLFVAQSI